MIRDLATSFWMSHYWTRRNQGEPRRTWVRLVSVAHVSAAQLHACLVIPPAVVRAALIQKISLSRVGALTCPVRSGAVFVGIVDRCRLATYSPPDAAQMLHAAVTAPACAAFDSLTDSDMVVEASEEGRLPPIVVTDEFPAGLIHEFSTDPDDLPAAWTSPESDQPIISLRPLLWFSYKSRREFAEFVVKYKSLALTYLGKSRVRHRGPKPASPMVGTIHLPDVSIVEDRWRGLANRTSTSGQGGAEIPSSSGDSFVSSDESSMEEAETTDPSEEHSLADDGGSSSDGGDGASVGSDVGGLYACVSKSDLMHGSEARQKIEHLVRVLLQDRTTQMATPEGPARAMRSSLFLVALTRAESRLRWKD